MLNEVERHRCLRLGNCNRYASTRPAAPNDAPLDLERGLLRDQFLYARVSLDTPEIDGIATRHPETAQNCASAARSGARRSSSQPYSRVAYRLLS
jgi:hypothetical protein